MTNQLPLILCPRCNGTMEEVQGKQPRLAATSFDSCLRRCEVCGIGASNALGRVTYIHRDPLTNIPEESREGALDALSAALNVRSRRSKRSRFGFSTSEDAVTWVVFSYLMRSKQLVRALQDVQLLPCEAANAEPTLLLWGVPIGPGSRGGTLRDQLTGHCAALGENPESFSEPDVIVDLGERGIVFIEVKHLSGNDYQPPAYEGWNKYESAGRLNWRFADVRETGCYELARNWCLLERLADGRGGTLANLGPARLYEGTEGARLDRFVSALGANGGLHFRKVTWAQLLGPFLPTAPDWLSRFCHHERDLLC